MDKSPRLYVAVLPDVFGHGLMAFSLIGPADAKMKLKEEYLPRVQHLSEHSSYKEFGECWAWYGGVIHEVDFNKVYDTF